MGVVVVSVNYSFLRLIIKNIEFLEDFSLNSKQARGNTNKGVNLIRNPAFTAVVIFCPTNKIKIAAAEIIPSVIKSLNSYFLINFKFFNCGEKKISEIKIIRILLENENDKGSKPEFRPIFWITINNP